MRNLMSINPFVEMRALEEILDRTLGAMPASTSGAGFTMPVDITERDGKLFIKASVPGVEPSEIEVSVENQILTIRGEHKSQHEDKETKVYRRELSYGRFTRSIRLPDGLDLQAIDAEFRNGFVTITIPRFVEEKPKALRVPIRTPDEPSQEPAS